MKLLKFGGTSLANSERFLYASEIIENNFHKQQVAVVLSAPAKITNYLSDIIEDKIYNDSLLEKINTAENIFIKLIKQILQIQPSFPYKETEKIIIKEFNQLKNIARGIILLKKCPKSICAIIISRGEVLSILIMKNLLISKNYQVTVINPVKYLISIGNYLDSTIDIEQSKKRIKSIKIEKDSIILMAGFIAGNNRGELVVLGRNGSDYSAAVLSACLDVQCCEIWTDVDGVFTSDPRTVPNAYLLQSISYKEAMELSYFGAKVLHPRTIEPIAKFKIPCFIKNTTNIKSNGTLICHKNNTEENFLKGITHLDNIALVNISGTNTENIIPRIFTMTSQKNIKIILITQSSSENHISFCIFEKDTGKILREFKKIFQLELKNKLLNPINIVFNLSILSIIGSNINQKYNIASKIFSCLSSLKINVLAIAQGSSKHSISIIIEKKYTLNAIQNIHEKLFLNKKIISVYLIGIGGIGQSLLKKILRQRNFLNKKNIEVKVCMIANSKKLLVLNENINLSNWQDHFNSSKKKFSVNILNQLIKRNSHINPVIIDCTSDTFLSKQYINFINNGFHIVTANKKANTSEWDYYQKIRNAILKTNKKFFYETNVGAGLPVIETLKNLFNTGDKLICFKGILSGSLSFIFGRLEEGILLSDATKEARNLGFTEPNPCEDLLGIDVARKLLILAREAGYQIELKDIEIEPILPNTFKRYKKIDEFLVNLKKIDSIFLEKVNTARATGNVLRFVGTIEKNGKCSVKIEEVNVNNPLYEIKNGENALAFYTNYYQPSPLFIRGYGAGNDVTSSRVFSDLLNIVP